VRIALVVERFAREGGGVEAVTHEVARGLAEAGEAVRVLCRECAGAPPEGVAVHRLPVPRTWQPARVLAFSAAAARATATLRPEIVHSFSRTLHQDVYRAGGGCHAAYLENRHGPRGARLRALVPRHRVLLAIERRIFANPRQIVQCNSELVAREIRERHGVPPERLVVIRNGVDLGRFHPDLRARARAPVRAELGLPEDALVLLFLGSGFHRKGLDTALAALAGWGAPEAHLVVAGRDDPGPWRRRATALDLGDRVHFLGAEPRPERLYAAADVLVLPTRYDAFANVCLEALAAGVPVVTSASNGAAEVLGDAGIVVERADDAAGFAAALAELADPERRAARACRARGIAEQFGWSRHIESLRELYRKVAA